MPSLRELQSQFARGVLAHDERILAAIAANGLEPSRRLGIYRNNVREGFLATLALAFPVVNKLAGDDWFRQTGTAYMRRHPSTSGNLHYVGRAFASFLDEHLASSEYRYFADVARLEWAYQEVLVAADHPSFDIGALASVPPEAYGALRFTTHPALRLVASPYPVFAIWQANKHETSDGARVRLDAGASRVLVIRRGDHVELRELASGEHALLDAFVHGRTLEAATEAALAAEPALDLGATLARIVQLQALVDFSFDYLPSS